MGKLNWLLFAGIILILSAPGIFPQTDEQPVEKEIVEEEIVVEEEPRNRLVIPEDEFVPTEQISEDNAVPFPVDI